MSPHFAAYALAGGVFVFDRITKALVNRHLTGSDTIAVIPGVFNIIHTQNRGAVFGVFAESASQWRQLILIGISTMVLIVVANLLWQATRRREGGRLLRTGLALLLGGAVGNLYDRVLTGSVTDFLQVFIGRYEWPAFNVADSAITVGAALLLLDLWKNRAREVRI